MRCSLAARRKVTLLPSRWQVSPDLFFSRSNATCSDSIGIAYRHNQRIGALRLLSDIKKNSTSSKTLSSLDSKWQDITRRLLDPNQTLSPTNFREAREALKFWMAEQKDVKRCWQLLDRLCEQPSNVPIVPADLLVPIVGLWQRKFKHFIGGQRYEPTKMQEKGLIWPSHVARRLDKYRKANILLACTDVKPILDSMLLDAAAHCSKHNRQEGVFFADGYFRTWLQDCKSGKTNVTPDIVIVGSVLHAWASSGLPDAPQRAESFWNESCSSLPHLVPNEFIYSSIIASWAKIGNPHKAAEWLERMRSQDGLQPDLHTWNSLLSAWANTTQDPNSAEKAETILGRMQALYESGQLNEPPNVISYSIVMNGWAQRARKNPKAAKRAQLLLERMQQSGNTCVKPNRISYNTVINAYSRAGNPHKAEELLMEMVELSGSSPEFGILEPNEYTCATVIAAWSSVGTFDAAERATRVLKDLMPKLGLKPNVFVYSNCITCWANVPPRKDSKNQLYHSGLAIERAQSLFDDLKHGDQSVQPDVVSYAALMNVYGKHGYPEKAETVMEELLNNYHKTGDERLKPNVHAFSVVLSAWAHSEDPNGAVYARAWLRRMKEEFQIEPNVVSYSTVLDAWCKRSKAHKAAPDQARAILETMRANKNPKAHPNVVSYTSVVRAYAEQGRALEAESLLEEMLENPLLPNPDVYTFSSVLYAWSKTLSVDHVEAAQRAEQLLSRMNELFQDGHIKEAPNIICYSNVLKCWARVRQGGAERAEAILIAMAQHDMPPNLISCNIVMNAWADQAKDDSTAVQRCRAVLDRVLMLAKNNKQLQPDEYTFGAMFKAISSSGLSHRQELTEDLMREMEENGVAPSASMARQLQRWKRKKQNVRTKL